MPPTSSTGPDTSIDASDSGATPISAPLRADGEQSVAWDDHCDVLVVGFGAAGACAAIEAATAGADVVVTDRFGGGGASARAVALYMRAAARDFKKPPAMTILPKRCTNTSAWKSATLSIARRCATSATAASR